MVCSDNTQQALKLAVQTLQDSTHQLSNSIVKVVGCFNRLDNNTQDHTTLEVGTTLPRHNTYQLCISSMSVLSIHRFLVRMYLRGKEWGTKC